MYVDRNTTPSFQAIITQRALATPLTETCNLQHGSVFRNHQAVGSFGCVPDTCIITCNRDCKARTSLQDELIREFGPTPASLVWVALPAEPIPCSCSCVVCHKLNRYRIAAAQDHAGAWSSGTSVSGTSVTMGYKPQGTGTLMPFSLLAAAAACRPSLKLHKRFWFRPTRLQQNAKRRPLRPQLTKA